MELRIPVGPDEVWAEHLAGDGVPVVLLHPEAEDSRVWDPLVPLLSGRRVVRYDVRGFGRSESATTEFALLDDLVAVLDQLALERVLLVGCSMGGGTALSLALADAARVHGLVLVCPEVTGFPWPDQLELEADTVPEWFEQTMYVTPDAPLFDRLHQIQTPTVVMVGTKDRPSLAAVAGATAARIPDANLVWLPTDHLTSLRQPQLVADTILRMSAGPGPTG